MLVAITLYGSCSVANKTTKTHLRDDIPLMSRYSQIYDSVIITNISGEYNPNGNVSNVLYKTKKEWFWDEYYERKDLLKKDSVVSKNCPTCPDIIKNIIMMGALSIPSEQDIKEPCRSTHDTTFNGQPVVEVKDLKTQADLAQYNIRIKFSGVDKILSYLSPDEALKICPESTERKQFLEIFKQLASVKKIRHQ